MLHEVSFPSYNKRDEVQGWIYAPAAKPKAVLQLIHGFGEHSRRYLHMIAALTEAGYIVAANDHVGHGKTAMVNDAWADWGDKGCHTMMEDEHTFKASVQEIYPDLPYFMYGHSMGSMIARDFAAKYGDELTGLILCGTCAEFPGANEVAAIIQAEVDAGKGEEANPKFAEALLGWMCERCGEIKLGNEWICHDVEVQLDHANDPFDAFTRPASNRSLLDFIGMMTCIKGTEWAEKVPAELPIYNIAGDEDPVGLYGEGVYQVSNWLTNTGHKVRTQLYSGYRHEIHNYADLKDVVEWGIIGFMDEVLGIETEEAHCCC
ncbi:MAG: alpha/beta fold hydrolase [Raoultibacter sp.]|jgi:alpha-beta hydrolase superfamily lysophospholipase